MSHEFAPEPSEQTPAPACERTTSYYVGATMGIGAAGYSIRATTGAQWNTDSRNDSGVFGQVCLGLGPPSLSRIPTTLKNAKIAMVSVPSGPVPVVGRRDGCALENIRTNPTVIRVGLGPVVMTKGEDSQTLQVSPRLSVGMEMNQCYRMDLTMRLLSEEMLDSELYRIYKELYDALMMGRLHYGYYGP